jgi:hypothetical protein
LSANALKIFLASAQLRFRGTDGLLSKPELVQEQPGVGVVGKGESRIELTCAADEQIELFA